MTSSGALFSRRKLICTRYVFCNLGGGHPRSFSSSNRIHDNNSAALVKFSASGLFRGHYCCASGSSQYMRHASTYASHQSILGGPKSLKDSQHAAPAAVGGLSSQEAKAKPKDVQESDGVAFTIRRRLWSFILGAVATLGAVNSLCRKIWRIESYRWKCAYHKMLARYDLGMDLLRADVRISQRLLEKLFQGQCLSKRERQLLVQTTADIFITVPAAKYIVLPSIDLVFPVLLRLFPKVLSSTTVNDKMTEQEPDIRMLKAKRKLKARREVMKFLSDTANYMVKLVGISQSGDIQPTAEEFFEFLTKISRGIPVAVDEVLGFAKLFNDELTLDNISRHQLVNMCKYMGITPFGTDKYMRFILQERLHLIKNIDNLIQAKGVESLSEAKLYEVCRERGIHVAGEMLHVGEEMRQQLRIWLDLSLNHSLPSSLLVLSRAFIVVGNNPIKPLEAVLIALNSLPCELKLLVGVTSLPSNNRIKDKIRKLKCLDLQENRIKEEEKKELWKMKKTDATQGDVALKEMTISKPEQARAVVKQQQHFELINDALSVLASALNVCTECEKISRLFSKEAVDMLPNLEKEIDDVDAKTGGRWQVIDRYCDGKVSLDAVAAATFLKDTLDKKGIQELLSNISNYKDEMMQKLVSGGLDTETPQPESASYTSDTKMPESDSSPTDRKTPESEFGMDFKHWFVQVKLPDGELSRDEIINFYISTLASVVGRPNDQFL